MAAGHVLNRDRRALIEWWWGRGKTFAEIAEFVGVNFSSVWRELKRYNSARHGTKNPLGAVRKGLYRWGYRADTAQVRADRARRRPKGRRLVLQSPLRVQVMGWLSDRFSPQQVAHRLRREFPDRPEMQVSHETIYQTIFLQGRGSLRELVDDAIRTRRHARRSQSRAAAAARTALGGRPWVSEDVHISARPAEADDRAIPGHWEGDLVIGKAGQSAIVTLVERSTRFVLLGELPIDRSSPEVLRVVRRLFTTLPAIMVKSLAWDQGTELAEHARFTLDANCPVYICDPHSPWQRGSNENTNGLLRQYFPKGVFDFRTIDQNRLDEVAAQLNRRPRRALDWETPAERLDQLLLAPTT